MPVDLSAREVANDPEWWSPERPEQPRRYTLALLASLYSRVAGDTEPAWTTAPAGLTLTEKEHLLQLKELQHGGAAQAQAQAQQHYARQQPGQQRQPYHGHNAAGGARYGRGGAGRPRSVLEKSGTGWTKLTSEERASVGNQIKLILNRLVETNCEEVSRDVLALKLDRAELLASLVEQLYEKAVNESKWVRTFAKLCALLEKAALHEQVAGAEATFRKLLTEHCHTAFDDDLAKWQEMRRRSRAGLDKAQVEALDLAELKTKARYLGNIQFIGELFRVNIVSTAVLTSCIGKLLRSADPPEEEALETLCRLLTSVGQQLQEKLNERRDGDDKAKAFMEAVFKRLRRYADARDKYSPRVRFLIQDLIDLRAQWGRPPAPASPAPAVVSPAPASATKRAPQGRSRTPPPPSQMHGKGHGHGQGQGQAQAQVPRSVSPKFEQPQFVSRPAPPIACLNGVSSGVAPSVSPSMMGTATATAGATRSESTLGMTPLPSLSRLSEGGVTPPVADVSPDPFRETEEAVARTLKVLRTELLQYAAGGDKSEFFESVRADVEPALRYLAVPAALQYLLQDARDGRRELERVAALLAELVDAHGLCDSLGRALDRFRRDFCDGYGEDTPAYSAEITGRLLAALAHGRDDAPDVLHAALACLARIADAEPYWNAPSRPARAAGFAATALAEMLRAQIDAQRASGAPDPHAAVRAMLDREAVDVRALLPLASDPALSRTRLADLLRAYGLEPLLPALADPALVLAPLAEPAMVPLTPEKLDAWLQAGVNSAGDDAASGEASTATSTAPRDSYFALLVAEHVFDVLKAEGAGARLEPWVAPLRRLPQPEHFQVGLLTLMSRHWSAANMPKGALGAMARTARDADLLRKPAFDRWRQDASDRNSTLKDQAFGELQDLFDDF